MSTALFVTQPAHEPTGRGSARPLNGQRERAVGYEGHPGLCNLCLPVPLFTGHNRCQPWLQDSRGPFTESGKSTRTRRTAAASSSVTARLHAESELESGTSGPFHPTARGPSDTLGDVLQDDLLDSPGSGRGRPCVCAPLWAIGKGERQWWPSAAEHTVPAAPQSP